MTNLYRAPGDPYSERQEANDPDPALRSPWDGCWAWTLARALDAATGGRIHGLGEDDIRAACGKPDRPGIADGGTLDGQVVAVQKLAPGLWFQARPSQAEFTAHLAAGGIAVMAGWESDAPVSDRRYDPGFYDRTGANGHSILGAGVGDGKSVIWGNPERFNGEAEPIVPIAAALKFVWDSQRGGYPRVEAILFRSVEASAVPAPTPPTPTPGGNFMDVIVISPVSQVNCAAGGSLRDATTGAVISARWAAQTGIYTWGKAGADTIIRVQAHTGGSLVAARYPTSLCTPIVATVDPAAAVAAAIAPLIIKIVAAKAALG